jgi:RNA polymerase sporulation-specific sigma factor
MNQGSSDLVIGIAKQCQRPNGLSLDELISAGDIGFREAVKRFNPDRGEKLSVYASRWIERSVKKALKLGRAPTAKEIGAIYAKGRRVERSPNRSSLSPASFDHDTSKAFMGVLVEAGLDSREQEIISLRYGVADGAPKTHKQIGQRLGLTRPRISQIEKAAREKLENLS